MNRFAKNRLNPLYVYSGKLPVIALNKVFIYGAVYIEVRERLQTNLIGWDLGVHFVSTTHYFDKAI